MFHGGAWIEVPGGQINLVSVRSPGEAVINQTGEAPSVDVSSFTNLGSIKLQRLTDMGYVNIMVDGYMDGSNGAGTIVVRGGQLPDDNRFPLHPDLRGCIP